MYDSRLDEETDSSCGEWSMGKKTSYRTHRTHTLKRKDSKAKGKKKKGTDSKKLPLPDYKASLLSVCVSLRWKCKAFCSITAFVEKYGLYVQAWLRKQFIVERYTPQWSWSVRFMNTHRMWNDALWKQVQPLQEQHKITLFKLVYSVHYRDGRASSIEWNLRPKRPENCNAGCTAKSFDHKA